MRACERSKIVLFKTIFKSKMIRSLIFCTLVIGCFCENKYSRSVNEKQNKIEKVDVDFRKLDRPFRMNKLNLLWVKAQQRLTEAKLKSLYSDLMLQDKEELIYKKVKGEGGDKEGFKEAELRRKLTNIMDLYGLREHFEDNVPRQKHHSAHNSVIDDHINKSIFKDKKLNQLWAKAEASGFTSEELSALKEEFLHHQEKIDQYYDLLNNLEDDKASEGFKNAVDDEDLVKFNEIKLEETNEVPQNKEKDYQDKSNLLKNKHRGLRDGFDRLHRITANGPDNKEFIEPKVQGLWKIASEANFTPAELESLKIELQHYESRLLKLRTLHADQVRNIESQHSKEAATGDKMDHFDHHQQMIKKHSRKVEKMHADLESRILARHTEL